jgi:hypothetical protein
MKMFEKLACKIRRTALKKGFQYAESNGDRFIKTTPEPQRNVVFPTPVKQQ